MNEVTTVGLARGCLFASRDQLALLKQQIFDADRRILALPLSGPALTAPVDLIDS